MRVLLLTNEVSRNDGWATVGYYVQEHLDCDHLEILTRGGADNEDCMWPVHPLISDDNHLRIDASRRDYLSIRNRLGDRPFDCVVCNLEPYLPLAYLLTRFLRKTNPAGVKLILIGHGTYIYYPFLKYPEGLLLRHFARSVNTLVTPSAFTEAKATEWFRGTTEVIPWGVDFRLYHRVEGVVREQAFVSVGQQKERKGTGHLIAAFKKLSLEYPAARLYVVGPITNEYVALASDLALKEKVIFTGKVGHQDLLRYYSRAMCHVLPSVNTGKAFEGYGLVHLEANACGLPTIGSSGTANQEIIVHGKTGFLCEQGDIAGLTDYMRRILSDPSSWRQMSQNALEHARNHGWEKTARLLSRVVTSCRNDHGTGI
jgi:glycosyltransferase involved in cell wall biosynthesis